jgi:sugar lactone lactonase YvrE
MCGLMRACLLALLLVFQGIALAQTVLKPALVAETAAGLSQPHDAAFSPDGKLIYVTDMANSRMLVLEAMTLKTVGSFGKGELSYPHDAEFDQQGRLLVADTGNNRIAIYEVEGAKARPVGELTGLSGPEGVAVAADGRIIVTNTRSGSLAVFRDGKPETTLGGYGARPGEFINPHDVDTAPDGSLHVVDSGNNRLQVLDASLKPLPSASGTLKLSGPKYLTFDRDRLWLADEYNHRILLLDQRHTLKGVLGTGERGRSENAFYKPEAVMARGDLVWVIDTYNDRIVLLKIANLP